MSPRRRLILSGTGALLTYLGFVLLWPIVDEWYAGAMATALDLTMRNIGWNTTARYGFGTDGGNLQLLIRFDHPSWANPSDARPSLRIFDQVYTQVTLLAALSLWTPLRWRRRVLGLAIAMAVLHVFFYILFWLFTAHTLSTHPLAPIRQGGSQHAVIENLVGYMTQYPPLWLAIPVVIWALATFRRGDLEALTHGRSSPVQSS